MAQLEFVDQLLSEISTVMHRVDDAQADKLVDAILEAGHVFVGGSGRSGLSAKAFAMRMMHMGIPVYVLGEIVTANFKPGDLLIVCSGSGETMGNVIMAQKAKSFGGKIALVTIGPGSTIGKLADTELFINAPTPKLQEQYLNSIQPMASLFEQCTLLVLDTIILKLMKRKKMTAAEMYGNHVNLE